MDSELLGYAADLISFLNVKKNTDVTEFISRAIARGKTGPHLVKSLFELPPWRIQNQQEGSEVHVLGSVASIKQETKKYKIPLVICLPNCRLLGSASVRNNKRVLLLAKNEVYLEEDNFTQGWNFVSWHEGGYGDGSTLSTARIVDGDRVEVVSSNLDVEGELLRFYFNIYDGSTSREEAIATAEKKLESKAIFPNPECYIAPGDGQLVGENKIRNACEALSDMLRKELKHRAGSKKEPGFTPQIVRNVIVSVLSAKGFAIGESEKPRKEGECQPWGSADEKLALWILKAKITDVHLNDAADFLAQRRLITTQDLANFICKEEEVSGPATRLIFINEMDEGVTKCRRRESLEDLVLPLFTAFDAHCLPKERKKSTKGHDGYWCATGAVMCRNAVHGFALWFLIILLIAGSVLVGVKSRGQTWERVEVAANLILTGAVAIFLAIIGLESEGRTKILDCLFFSKALKEIPARDTERRKALEALKSSKSPHLYVKGSVSWMNGRCQGWTRMEDPIPLDEIGDGFLRVGAFGMSANILGKERVIELEMETGILRVGRELENEPLRRAIVRVCNCVC